MKLPLHHLHRLRRKIRRTMTDLRDRETLRILEEWTGHRPATPPRDTMKLLRQLATLIILGLAFAWVMTSCATVETRTTVTAPDGTVTVTESKTTAPDSASVAALSTTALVFAPRAVIVRQEKSGTPADLQRILRGRPITREEIAARWQPSTP